MREVLGATNEFLARIDAFQGENSPRAVLALSLPNQPKPLTQFPFYFRD
jgi:hypothetical protein